MPLGSSRVLLARLLCGMTPSCGTMAPLPFGNASLAPPRQGAQPVASLRQEAQQGAVQGPRVSWRCCQVPAAAGTEGRAELGRAQLMDEFHQVLQSRTFCSSPRGALEAKGDISPPCSASFP